MVLILLSQLRIRKQDQWHAEVQGGEGEAGLDPDLWPGAGAEAVGWPARAPEAAPLGREAGVHNPGKENEQEWETVTGTKRIQNLYVHA